VTKTLACIGLAAAMALTPFAVLAQSASPPAPKHHHYSAQQPTSSFRSEMRKRHNTSKERARASAEHVRSVRQQ
jgi:hypothetical protein